MAPPVNRRTGTTRRAQYSHFFAYVAGVIGALAGAGLLVASLADHTRFAWLRGFASDITAPPTRGLAASRAALADAGATLAGFFASGAETAHLRREIALARVRQVGADATQAENGRLKAVLGLASLTPRPVANAWLIASTATATRRFATISAGARAGVRPGMPVRTPLGLVGRVLEVGQVSARVLLLTDSESTVPVRRARDGLPAFATGRADGTLQLRLISLGLNPLRVGDAFVTSGSGGLYWPGTPIAVVRQLTRDGAIGEVLGDPAASELVAVQPVWDPVADPTLPPPPGPPAATGHHRK